MRRLRRRVAMMVVRIGIRKEINHKRAGDWGSEVKGRKGFQDDRNGLEFGVTVDVDEETGPFG
jgi:hypothetical protein